MSKAKKKAASEWAADSVERRPIVSLSPYDGNARTHSPEQIAQIAASIQQFGWTVPILVDEAGEIIAGHGRVLAAQSLGITDVPVIVASGWTEAQKRAYVIADNKLTLNGDWDLDLLRSELAALDGLGFDLTLTGFGQGELDALFGAAIAPVEFPDKDEAIPTEHQCPKCGYKWSGKSKALDDDDEG